VSAAVNDDVINASGGRKVSFAFQSKHGADYTAAKQSEA
jgi:hypothetical protein